MMDFVSATARHWLPAAALIVAFLLPAPALSAGAFSSMAGSWSGGGTITLENGSRERIRCRATYTVDGTGNNMNQNLRCASDSYQFTLTAAVTYRDGALNGTWSELTRGVSGFIDGGGSAGRFEVMVNGPGFVADLVLSTRGNRQTIQITSKGEMRNISINLSR